MMLAPNAPNLLTRIKLRNWVAMEGGGGSRLQSSVVVISGVVIVTPL